MSLSAMWEALRRPVHPETRAHLAELWSELPAGLRTEDQLLGRQWEGCAATVGAMPRCDFGCTACYLGSEANSTPGLPLPALREQLRRIRAGVGRWGNVQLTDGEIALRPIEDLLQLLEWTRELELIPMLMTHGDGFRRQPERLERLVAEGGLAEISFHVDTTQRGRFGYEGIRDEARLHPLREELAELVRRVRRRTGRELRVASTVTVTRANLDGVPSIVRWMVEHGDVFRILSFQPVADVGRTREAAGPSRTELWDAISAGLGEAREAPASAWNSDLRFGHPDCTHVVMGSVWKPRGAAARFVPLRDPEHAPSERRLRAFFERFGGLSFRSDAAHVAAARGAGVLLQAPLFWLSQGPAFALRTLSRLSGEPSGRVSAALSSLGQLATRRASLRPLALVSHHFMDAPTLESDLGREREAACVFRVPHGDELVSMCRMNAGGLRRRVYAELKRQPAPL